MVTELIVSTITIGVAIGLVSTILLFYSLRVKRGKFGIKRIIVSLLTVFITMAVISTIPDIPLGLDEWKKSIGMYFILLALANIFMLLQGGKDET